MSCSCVLRSDVVARGLHVRISDEGHDGWMRFCASHGVTLTALLEVVGRKGPATVFGPKQDALIREARELAHERRAAGGPRKSG